MNLRIGEAAAILNVCVDTLRRYEKEGRIKSVRFGNQRRFDSDAVELLKRAGTAPKSAVPASEKRAAALAYRRAGDKARKLAAAQWEQQQQNGRA